MALTEIQAKAVVDTFGTELGYIRVRLCTEKTRPTYEIYKHLGFKESPLVTMKGFYIVSKRRH